MTDDNVVNGTSLTSFADAADQAFAEIPGDPNREGLKKAEVTKMWLMGGGFVGATQYSVELRSQPPGE